MKYELTDDERQKINAGEIITVACYTAEKAAMCEYVARYNGVTCTWRESESLTGRQIFIFFLFPHNYYRAFNAGAMLQSDLLYGMEDEVRQLTKFWEGKFTSNDAVKP